MLTTVAFMRGIVYSYCSKNAPIDIENLSPLIEIFRILETVSTTIQRNQIKVRIL